MGGHFDRLWNRHPQSEGIPVKFLDRPSGLLHPGHAATSILGHESLVIICPGMVIVLYYFISNGVARAASPYVRIHGIAVRFHSSEISGSAIVAVCQAIIAICQPPDSSLLFHGMGGSLLYRIGVLVIGGQIEGAVQILEE